MALKCHCKLQPCNPDRYSLEIETQSGEKGLDHQHWSIRPLTDTKEALRWTECAGLTVMSASFKITFKKICLSTCSCFKVILYLPNAIAELPFTRMICWSLTSLWRDPKGKFSAFYSMRPLEVFLLWGIEKQVSWLCLKKIKRLDKNIEKSWWLGRENYG